MGPALGRHSMVNQQEVLKFFAALIEQECGIVYSETNYFQLESRLETLAKQNGCGSIEDFFQLVKGNPRGACLESVIDVATNNETLFFRDQKIFSSVQDLVSQPEMKLLSTTRPLNFWSAACSTGQEPISLSICLHQVLGSNYRILATDISNRVLDTARTGIYSELQISRGMPEDLKNKYFESVESNKWKIKDIVHSRIEFRKLNLKAEDYPREKFDVILCRNVLLYQKDEAKIEIIKKLSSCINPKSYLILGSGESTLGLSKTFQPIEVKGAILYQSL